MKDMETSKRDHRHVEGKSRKRHERAPTCQELLDEALEPVEPASHRRSRLVPWHPDTPTGSQGEDTEWALQADARGRHARNG